MESNSLKKKENNVLYEVKNMKYSTPLIEQERPCSSLSQVDGMSREAGSFCYAWREFFYLFDYILISRISKCGDREKKLSLNLSLKHKISGTSGMIYIDDIYSKKEVNFSPKKLN